MTNENSIKGTSIIRKKEDEIQSLLSIPHNKRNIENFADMLRLEREAFQKIEDDIKQPPSNLNFEEFIASETVAELQPSFSVNLAESTSNEEALAQITERVDQDEFETPKAISPTENETEANRTATQSSSESLQEKQLKIEIENVSYQPIETPLSDAQKVLDPTAFDNVSIPNEDIQEERQENEKENHNDIFQLLNEIIVDQGHESKLDERITENGNILVTKVNCIHYKFENCYHMLILSGKISMLQYMKKIHLRADIKTI